MWFQWLPCLDGWRERLKTSTPDATRRQTEDNLGTFCVLPEWWTNGVCEKGKTLSWNANLGENNGVEGLMISSLLVTMFKFNALSQQNLWRLIMFNNSVSHFLNTSKWSRSKRDLVLAAGTACPTLSRNQLKNQLCTTTKRSDLSPKLMISFFVHLSCLIELREVELKRKTLRSQLLICRP